MKRLSILVAFILALTAVGMMVLESEAQPANNIQFEGYVTKPNDDPAPIGTKVEVFLNGTFKERTTIQGSDGYYRIRGDDADFPTGSYLLRADDQIGLFGEENCSHTQYTATVCDIVLDIAY